MRLLADLMQRHQWRAKEKLDFARLDGRLILVNGHHRLGSQALAGLRMEWIVVIHECASADEVAELYFTFDTNCRQRSPHTILNVVGLGPTLGIGKDTASRLWSAIPLLNSDFDFSILARPDAIDKAIDRRLDLARSYKREILAWETATRPASNC
jgi:hypothetical protein